MNLPIPALEARITAPSETREKARILVVDDDDYFRGREETVLNRASYRTMGAADGEEALAPLRTGDFDLVLTDWNMPKLDGVGLIRALRAAGNRIPLIMISSSVITGRDLPDDIRSEVAVALPKDADASQILAGVAQASHALLPPPAAPLGSPVRVPFERGLPGT
jgi:CheY-like chemotaxis protein